MMRIATVEEHAKARALKDRESFLQALGGSFVLVRLDERGGHDDPVPWAFGRDPKAAVVNWNRPRDDEGVNMNSIRKALNEVTPIGEGAPTATNFAAPPLVPEARGAASVLVLSPGAGVVLGRAEADVVVDERSVSRRHATLAERGEGLELTDLGSSNGTRRNGQSVGRDAPVSVSSGDVVELGDVKLLLLSTDDYWVRLPELAD